MVDESSTSSYKKAAAGRVVAQFVGATVALFVLYMLARFVTSAGEKTAPVMNERERADVQILRVATGSGQVVGTTLDTHPSKAESVLDLRPSSNQPGGDQFSLSFRIAMVDGTFPVDRCVLLWGDPNRVKFSSPGGGAESIEHMLVFAPMIWLSTAPAEGDDEGDGDARYRVNVFFNTTNTVRNECAGDLRPRKNLGRTVVDVERGCVVTVTFSDYSVNGLASGCICKVYVETALVASVTVRGESIRRSSGLMYILPSLGLGLDDTHVERDTSPSNIKLWDLSYHNYEMRVADIQAKMAGTIEYVKNPPISREPHSVVYDPRQDMTYQYLASPSLW